MCGLAGFVDFQRRIRDPKSTLEAMHRCIAYRGPDDSGTWFDPATATGFAHRRLSIVDLSPEGHQPMASESGRFTIVFNGEVYNFADLRAELEPAGHRFRGHSDTEVMLAAFEEWGVEASVRRFVGMFAFALLDHRERRLTLVRDRLGIKPLYVGRVGDGESILAFASELKPFLHLPGFRNHVDRDALAAYLRFLYVPGPMSIYQGVRKLLPGHMLHVDLASGAEKDVCYWNARAVAERGVSDPVELSDADAESQLESLLKDAVKLRMIADVPLGAFLSGGIDSSTVVAIMQSLSPRPVKTFTIGFKEAAYDEAEHARRVAEHLGTDHTDLRLSPEETMASIPTIAELYDEPFADSSQIPTWLVSKLARTKVTVSLSGDGGDELFGGYHRYVYGDVIWRRMQSIPRPLRAAAGAMLQAVPAGGWDAFFSVADPLLPRHWRHKLPGQKMHKLGVMARARSGDEVYRSLLSAWMEPDRMVVSGREPLTGVDDPERQAQLPDLLRRMMYTDLVTYLVDDILTKVDRATMGVSLEGRVPLLDHRVVEYAWRLPLRQKFRDGQGKWLLRQVLYRHVPKDLVERPKMGFGIPIDDWLRGPLRPWAEGLLDPARLRREGFLHPEPIHTEWRHYLRGSGNHNRIWGILMFQTWLDRYKPSG
ncbi:MAG: asparagine synthase (glutamine-hydrolyzing) [Phycisphaerales bacterium]